MELNNKFYMQADIEVVEPTEALRKEAASVLKLPRSEEKQPDLQYFSAIFVSSGTNLNWAHFLPSELVMAGPSVPSKAVDIEHEEEEIIGHIYDYAFIDAEGKSLSPKELSSTDKKSLDSKDIHIVIAGVVYKNRFPDLAEEIEKGEWKVSMEAYYQDYAIKVGDVILDKSEALACGYDVSSHDKLFGQTVKVIKDGIEIANDKAARVLLNILFSGVGIVKKPANPPSVILETATEKNSQEDTKLIDKEDESGDLELVLDISDNGETANNNLTSSNIEDEKTNTIEVEDRELIKDGASVDDSPGQCVNYKHRLTDNTTQAQGPDTKILKERWCTAFNTKCTSYYHEATDPDCLRNKVKAYVSKAVGLNTDYSKQKTLVDILNKNIKSALNLLR